MQKASFSKNLLFHIVNVLVVFFFISCKNVKKEYYSDGNIKLEVEYKNGLYNGLYKSYYPNGNIKKESFYIDGNQTGITRSFYENGALEWEVNYSDGKENGIYRSFTNNGVLKAISNFNYGKQEGITCFFYENGKIESIQEYMNSVRFGKAVFYYKNSQIKLKSIADDQRTVYYTEYDENGQRVNEYRYVSIIIGRDTLIIGEKHKTRVKVFGPIPKNAFIEVLLADRETTFGTPMKKVSLNSDGIADFIIEPDLLGYNILNVKFQIDTLIFSNIADLLVIQK